tara:strand:- start:62 stop:982 length:921 start_codon:yes stop_codon:yes gene_type:complete
MKFDELYKEIVESTSKAPKGDSYDSQNNWKPSGVDSASDGSGGRYRRTRPNKQGRSKATHGGRGVEDAETMGSAMRGLDKISGEQEADKLYGAIHAEVEGGKSVEEVLKDMNYPEQNHKAMSISYKNWLASNNPSEGDVLDDHYNDRELERMKRGEEAAEGQSLADDFMEFASLVSAAEQGQEVDIDKLRIELNALDERLEALKSEESEETFDQLYDRYVSTSEEDAERVDKDRMKCNSPRRTSGGSKKFVVKACKDGKEKVVRFGDPNMKIKKSNPKRRKSFRARHKCDQKKDKFSAGYWSCKKW